MIGVEVYLGDNKEAIASYWWPDAPAVGDSIYVDDKEHVVRHRTWGNMVAASDGTKVPGTCAVMLIVRRMFDAVCQREDCGKVLTKTERMKPGIRCLFCDDCEARVPTTE